MKVHYTLNDFYLSRVVVELEGDSDMAVSWQIVPKRRAGGERAPTTFSFRAPAQVRLRVSLLRAESGSDTVSSIILPIRVEPYTDHGVFVSISSFEPIGFGSATAHPLAAGVPSELRMMPNDSLFVWWGWTDRRNRGGSISVRRVPGEGIGAQLP